MQTIEYGISVAGMMVLIILLAAAAIYFYKVLTYRVERTMIREVKKNIKNGDATTQFHTMDCSIDTQSDIQWAGGQLVTTKHPSFPFGAYEATLSLENLDYKHVDLMYVAARLHNFVQRRNSGS